MHPIVRARWLILALFAVLCALVVPGVGRLQNDDDVLAFLPPDHPDVVGFRELAERFGMLEVALIGLAPPDGDVLIPEEVDRVRALTVALGEHEGVRLALSFPDLPDPQVTADGMVVAALVPPELRDPAEIRRRVLASRDAVGNLVAADGAAAAVLVFLLPRPEGVEGFAARHRTLASLRRTVDDGWDGEIHFAGAPFIETEASESSRHDIEELSPIVIIVLALASALLLRSVTAAVINLCITGLGVGLIMGAHGWLAEPLTIVSSSTPVMMVALGGAFGVHVLAGYQRRRGTSPERASAVLRELWLPVLLSGTTTAVAFFALLVMPQAPMQRFGVAAGMGMLVLLVLALVVTPALLAILPPGLLVHRPDLKIPVPPRPPTWVLAGLFAGGAGLGLTLRADPDTSTVFEDDAAPRRADAFFQRHFGGSTWLQIAFEGPDGGDPALLQQAHVLRRIRDVAEDIAEIDGVVDVRSVVEPVALLNAALGGRRGVPESDARARRVLTYLVGHPAMAQLMTDDVQGALLHVELAPMSGAEQVERTARVRAILDEHGRGGLRVAAVADERVAERHRADVARRLNRRLGRGEADAIVLPATTAGGGASPEALARIAELRDNLFDESSEDNIFDAAALGIQPAEIRALDPTALVRARGAELEGRMRAAWPTVAAGDAPGLTAAAEHLGSWIDEVLEREGVADRCVALQLSAGDCARARDVLAELDDPEWAIGPDDPIASREIPLRVRLTGQPVIGEAFADSVTTSLAASTAVSVVALALVLAVSRFLVALVPALWTLGVTAGVVALLGHPISVGTSMVACIAVGAGVDFAIHLAVRARASTGADRAARAVAELGPVMSVGAIQLALAFLVLAASDLRPLAQFGVGLAVGLVGAALGAIWLAPLLVPRDPAPAAIAPATADPGPLDPGGRARE